MTHPSLSDGFIFTFRTEKLKGIAMKLYRIFSFAVSFLLFINFAQAQDSMNVRRVGILNYPYVSAYQVVVVGNLAYITLTNITSFSGFGIVDISNPTDPVDIGGYVTSVNYYAYDVAVSGNYAYVVYDESGLQVINITNPVAPTYVGMLELPLFANGIAVAGNYAYVADGYGGLRVIDITNPAVPTEVGLCDTVGYARDVVVEGNFAYVADYFYGLRVINIVNPDAPVEVGSYDTPGTAVDVAVAGSYAYIADGDSGLRIINITNPAAPTEVGFYNTSSSAGDVAVAGNYAYIVCGLSGLRVINITNPAMPAEVGFYEPQGVAFCVALVGNYVCMADGIEFGIYDCSAATGISESPILQPSSFSLSCYPNPFNPTTTVSLDVPRAERVRVNVYNVAGQLVRTLVDERLTPGTHAIRFDGTNLSSGTYLCRLGTGEFVQTRKVVLIR